MDKNEINARTNKISACAMEVHRIIGRLSRKNIPIAYE